MPSFHIDDLLTAFNPTGEYLAVSAGDGRVKIWDTLNGTMKFEFVDTVVPTSGDGMIAEETKGHLAVDYTCMTWNPIVKKGKKKSRENGIYSLLVFGTGAGDVLALDTILGKLKWRIKDCHPGGVRSLDFAKSGGTIYSAGSDGMVCEHNAIAGETIRKFRASKRAVSCIAVSSDGGSLVAGSSELKLFDLLSKKRLLKFMGHPDAVKAVIFTEDGKYILSSAVGERFVAVWHNDLSKSGSAAMCVLSMEHPAVSLDCSVGETAALRVLAISKAGDAYIWHASSFEDLAKMKPIKITVAALSTGKTGKRSRPGILAARLIGKIGDGPGSVLVAYGTTVKPVFERLSITTPNDIVLHLDKNGILMPSTLPNRQNDSKVCQAEALVLGPDNAVDATHPKPHVECGEALVSNKVSLKKRRRASVDLDEQLQPVGVDCPKTTAAEWTELDGSTRMPVDDNEETMEEKLRALGLIEGDGNEERAVIKDEIIPPSADSLQLLLTQALLADDNLLLEQCLSVSDEKVIENTVRRLRSIEAGKFLQVSVFKMEARPKRSLMLIPWIRAVLLYHATYIMSNPSMQSILRSLYQVIDARLSVFRPLLSLSGRLDLIVAQISSNAGDEVAHAVETAAVYEDESDENAEGDIEDVMEDISDTNDDSSKEVDGTEGDVDMIPKNDEVYGRESDGSEDF
eukprot:c27515_g1_i1 orf=278-2332(+)